MAKPNMVTDVSCEQAYDLLFDYIEGNLSEALRAGVERHISVCPPCLEFVNSYRKTPNLVREAVNAEAVPEEVTQRLRSFLRSHIPRE